MWQRRLDQTAGDLALYHYPRLYDAATGHLASEWPDLATGEVGSSIVWNNAFTGTARIAVDEQRLRFAVTEGQTIAVLLLDSDQNQ